MGLTFHAELELFDFRFLANLDSVSGAQTVLADVQLE
jgi:hypothetical protein